MNVTGLRSSQRETHIECHYAIKTCVGIRKNVRAIGEWYDGGGWQGQIMRCLSNAEQIQGGGGHILCLLNEY
jgi:hypothetical protein